MITDECKHDEGPGQLPGALLSVGRLVGQESPTAPRVGRSAGTALAGVRGVEGLERVGVEAADESLDRGHVPMVATFLERSKESGHDPRHETPVTLRTGR